MLTHARDAAHDPAAKVVAGSHGEWYVGGKTVMSSGQWI